MRVVCRTGSRRARLGRCQPVHRRQLAEVALFAGCEHPARRRSPAWKFAPSIATSTTPRRAIFADAFLHDPGLGCRRAGSATAHRHGVLRRYHRAALDVIRAYGGPIYGAFDDGRLVGVAATFAAGLYPPPHVDARLFRPRLPPRRPGPIVRGLRFSAVQEKGHRDDEHVYLWFLAVDPQHQRGGVGRSLLARVYEDADRARLSRHGQSRRTSPTTRATATRRSAGPPVPAARRCGL